MQPVFSIITVTYNAAPFLERTLQSVLGQTYPGIEYILIDGKSEDNTVEIIRQYQDRLSYWHSEPDEGLYDAMNKGLRQATGDYVWFINAGDTFYTNNTLREVADLIRSENTMPDILYGETMIVGRNGKALGLRRLRAPERLTWRSFRMGMLVCHQSFVVKREIAPAYDTRYQLSSDIDWCIRCLQKARNIQNTRQVLSCFMEDGMSSTQRKQSLKERFRILSHYYGYLPVGLLHLWFALRFYSAKWFKGRV